LLPELLRWLEQTDDRLFLLTGGPGSGKSMILAWLASFGPSPEDPTARAQLARVRELVKAAHFCQAASRNVAPKAFADSVANQLTETVPGFGDALTATLAERVQIVGVAHADTAALGANLTGNAIGRIDLGTLGDELSFDRAFTEPLKKLYESGHGDPMLILVDALDEALGYTGDKTLPDLLSTLSDLPSEVRILVTTRDDPRVLAFYNEVQPFDLIKKAPSDVDDVRNYVAHRLTESAALPQAQRVEFSRRLATQAKGVFLYAAMVLDELLPRLPQFPDLEAYPLPEGLSGLYRAFLKRELGTEDKGRRWHQIYKPLLGLIAVAQGEGLTAAQLSALIGQEVAEPLDACKQYLDGELPVGPFRLFHKSFADFLLEDPENRRYHVDAEPMHRRIADYYWQRCHGNGQATSAADWSRCDEYGLEWLATHLFEARDSVRLAALISQPWMKVRTGGYRFSGFVADVEHAWRAALQQSGERAVVEGLRCGLIRTSFNSISQNHPPALVARAFEENLWPLDRVLTVAADLRGFTAVTLCAAVLGTQRLAPVDRVRLARLAMEQAQLVRDAPVRASTFQSLVRSLDGELRQHAIDRGLEAARTVVDPGRRAHVLTEYAPMLTGLEQRQVLLETVELVESQQGWTSPDERSSAIRRLAPLVDSTLASRVLPLVSASSAAARAAQAALAPRLAPDQREPVVSGLLNWVRSEMVRSASRPAPGDWEASVDRRRSVHECFDLLVSVMPFLSQDTKRQLPLDAKAWVPAFDVETHFGWLFNILPQLEPRFVALAAQSARDISDRVTRAEAFASLAAVGSIEERERFLREAEDALRDAKPLQRARSLRPWVALFDGEQRDALARQILTAAIDATRAADGGHLASEEVAVLLSPIKAALPYAPDDLIGALLQLALTARFGAFRDELLALLAPRVPSELLGHALAAEIGDEVAQVMALCGIARRLSGAVRQPILQHAVECLPLIQEPYHRAKAATAIVPLVEGDERRHVLQVGLKAAGQSSAFAPLAIAALAPFVTEDFIDRAVEAVEGMRGGLPGSREESAAAIARRMTDVARTAVLTKILDSFTLLNEAARQRVLEQLIPGCDGDLLKRCWEEARKLSDPRYRAQALVLVATRLSGDAKSQALREAEDAAATIDSAFYRATVTCLVAREREGEAKARAVAAAEQAVADVEPPSSRAEALTHLLPLLPDEEQRLAVSRALDGLKQASEMNQAFALERLLPHVSGDMLGRAVEMALNVANGSNRARVAAIAYRRLLEQAVNVKQWEARLGEVAKWLFSLRDLNRSKLLGLCSESVFESDSLTPEALTAAAGHIRQIANDWRFATAGLARPPFDPPNP
jgi:hypothetical protein